jgi:hypothetical protein
MNVTICRPVKFLNPENSTRYRSCMTETLISKHTWCSILLIPQVSILLFDYERIHPYTGSKYWSNEKKKASSQFVNRVPYREHLSTNCMSSAIYCSWYAPSSSLLGFKFCLTCTGRPTTHQGEFISKWDFIYVMRLKLTNRDDRMTEWLSRNKTLIN